MLYCRNRAPAPNESNIVSENCTSFPRWTSVSKYFQGRDKRTRFFKCLQAFHSGPVVRLQSVEAQRSENYLKQTCLYHAPQEAGRREGRQERKEGDKRKRRETHREWGNRRGKERDMKEWRIERRRKKISSEKIEERKGEENGKGRREKEWEKRGGKARWGEVMLVFPVINFRIFPLGISISLHLLLL